ncbi:MULTISPECIES: S41 family peptidase [unclassified Sphingomonas]|uniref:S41 family peptidase n=1 Tax=unclassified Sphingomonas TaxID=196159 RepID=UPI0008362B6D|nr:MULTISPECIES: S41 family peptidase [unclassified Sphingomonas]
MRRRELLNGLATTGALMLSGRGGASATAQGSVGDLKGDMAILRGALALHPGLYRYLSPRAAEAGLTTLEAEYLAAPDLAARYLALSRFLATIRCGHSYCNFFNQRRVIVDALFDRPTRLPFAFRWIDGDMVVTADHSGTGRLARGTVITRVNGLPARTLLATLMPYARADGGNDGKRRSLLEVRGDDSIEYFDVFQALILPPRDGVHHIEARMPGGSVQALDLPAIDLAARRGFMPPPPGPQDVQWDWQMRDDGVAVLTMPGWALYNSKWDWRGWLGDRLASLGGAKGLVVDLRDNEGGLDCGDDILARLTTRDLTFPGDDQRIRFRRTPAALDPYLDTWDDGFRTLGEGATALGDGWYRRPAADEIQAIPAMTPRITVPVAALIGPVNSSATFQFARRARQTGLVRLFGGESGGNRRGINGGCFFFVRLPGSGIEFDLPLVGYFPAQPQPDAGIQPDVQVQANADDIVHGRDPTLAAALEWVRRA